MTAVVPPDFPFSNASLITIVLLMTDFQKISLKCIFAYYLQREMGPQLIFTEHLYEQFVVTQNMKYLILSIQMTMIVIPIRQNFAIHNIEL